MFLRRPSDPVSVDTRARHALFADSHPSWYGTKPHLRIKEWWKFGAEMDTMCNCIQVVEEALYSSVLY